jgi:glycine dehydrogenase subunit 2
MLMTRRYHIDRGEPHRDKVIIPDSAHWHEPGHVRIAGDACHRDQVESHGLVDLER